MIANPYKDISSAFRQKMTTHEHICGNTVDHAWHQQRLQDLINRGNDIVAGVNYQPAVPTYPLTGFSHKYKAFKAWDDLTVVDKEFSAYYEDFVKDNGDICRIADVVALPNAEHAWFRLPSGKVNGGLHINLVGSMYGEPASEIPTNWEGRSEDLYQWRLDHPLYTLKELLQLSKESALFGTLFGTLNHPGYTGLSVADAISVMKVADEVGDVIHAVEIYNNGDSKKQHAINESVFDGLLMAGYKLNCVSVVDWSNSFASDAYNTDGDNKGTNVLLLPNNYESLAYADKQKSVMSALRNGAYYATGLASFSIENISVDGNVISVEFDAPCDNIECVIDGLKTHYYNTKKVTIGLGKDKKYVRFKATKGTDFIYTNPFFNLDIQKGVSNYKKMIVFDM